MLVRNHIKKIAIATLLIVGVQMAFAAFTLTGITEKRAKDSKYTLKNMHHLSTKAASYSSLKYSLHLKTAPSVTTSTLKNDGVEISSMLRYDNGNTSFVYPYKFKVKVPKFKTPAPTQR